MAKRAKKRHRKGQGRKYTTPRKYTPDTLKGIWDNVIMTGVDEGVVTLPITLAGVEIHNFFELRDAYLKHPRQFAYDTEQFIERHLARLPQIDEELLELDRQKGIIEGKAKVQETIKGMNLEGLPEDRVRALEELAFGDKTDRVMDALGAITKIQERTGRSAQIEEIEDMLKEPREEIEELLDLARRSGLAGKSNSRWAFERAITDNHSDRTDHPAEKRRAAWEVGGRGVCAIPTPTVRHLARIARDEGLPLALTDEALNALAPGARHIIVQTDVMHLADGHAYLRVQMLCGLRKVLDLDEPGMEHYNGLPLVEAAKDMTRKADDELPEYLRQVRAEWVERGYIEQREDGSYSWGEVADEDEEGAPTGMRDVEDVLQSYELNHLDPTTLACDMPIRQIGLLLEAGELRVPDEDGEEMPVHGGARSFAPIWKRASELTEYVRRAEELLKRKIETDRAGDWDIEEDGAISWREWMKPQLPWSSRAIAAAGVLSNMRTAKTVAVEMDVSEGLPDWESIDEAWEYAKDAELPFPMTYFDFTSPGGYRPKVAITNQDPDTGKEREWEMTLRAALCWKEGNFLTIAPFVWLDGDRPSNPRELAARNDYDSPGALHFGIAGDHGTRLRGQTSDGRVMDLEEELEPINYTRTTSAGGVSGPSQVLLTEPIFGAPGWVDLFGEPRTDDATLTDRNHADVSELLQAEAMMVTAAACRVLSVIYALDGTVNIELVEGEPARQERREVERAQRKGKPAEISMTVRIHPTKQDEREKPDREGSREYSHAFYRRGHFAHYPIGTRMADRMAEQAPSKLVNHPVKGLCRKIYRKPTIVGRIGPGGEEREPVAKSYVWGKKKPQRKAPTPDSIAA